MRFVLSGGAGVTRNITRAPDTTEVVGTGDDVVMVKDPDTSEVATVVEGTFEKDVAPAAVDDIKEPVGIEDPGITVPVNSADDVPSELGTSALVDSADDVPSDSADVAKISEPVDATVNSDTVVDTKSPGG